MGFFLFRELWDFKCIFHAGKTFFSTIERIAMIRSAAFSYLLLEKKTRFFLFTLQFQVNVVIDVFSNLSIKFALNFPVFQKTLNSNYSIFKFLAINA